jgi:hypothetical protein
MKNKMDEVIIYRFQLESILDVLQLTSRYNNSSECDTCYNRDITQAIRFTKNALDGNPKLQATRFKEQNTHPNQQPK